MDIKTKIRELMVARGMTMYSLAQASDLTLSCISNWYSKRNYEPSVGALEKVCAALGISMAELFCSEDEEMIPVDQDLRDLFNIWSKLTPAQKDAIFILLKSYNID